MFSGNVTYSLVIHQIINLKLKIKKGSCLEDATYSLVIHQIINLKLKIKKGSCLEDALRCKQ